MPRQRFSLDFCIKDQDNLIELCSVYAMSMSLKNLWLEIVPVFSSFSRQAPRPVSFVCPRLSRPWTNLDLSVHGRIEPLVTNNVLSASVNSTFPIAFVWSISLLDLAKPSHDHADLLFPSDQLTCHGPWLLVSWHIWHYSAFIQVPTHWHLHWCFLQHNLHTVSV